MSNDDSVLAVLERHVTPLHRKVRGGVLAQLASELTVRELEHGAPERLVSYVLRMKHVAEDKLAACAGVEQRWDGFMRRYFKHHDERGRRQVMNDYLTETVPDPVQRRACVAALDRFLDYDTLHERFLIERHNLLVVLEIAVTFIANAGIAALDHATSRSRDALVRDMLDGGQIEAFLHELAETGRRWQIRRAALEGLAGLAHAARRDGTWHGRLRSKHLGVAVRCATNPDDHPWLQGSAIKLVTQLQPDLALDLLTKRLFEPAANPRDFLVRRQCVELLAAGDARARELLRKLLTHGDASEHVRQGLAEAFARLDGLGELAVLAGVDDMLPEPSPRVRATAVRALCRPGRKRDLGPAIELVIRVLARDPDPLPLAIACDEIATLVDREPVPRALAESLLTALLALAAHPERSPMIHETAAAAAERVHRTMTFEDRAWRDYLETVTRQIRPGRSWSVRLSKLRSLPPLPADPMFLGRVLAELSRRDFPLFATLSGGRLVVWRGDRYRRRLWRILHELRSLRPNKRQAYRHTVGRTMRGHLRAPPGMLDEVTATVVPGERVFVAEEGGWGRHVPAVDDILDLPIWTGDPVRIYSSFGVTTVRPPATFWARVRNRFAVSGHYATLSAVRLASLSGVELHARQRYAHELRVRYGIVVSFDRYDYPSARALAPARLIHMFAPQIRHPLEQIVEQPS